MSGITIPIELELTPRSRAVMDAIYKAIGQQFKSDAAGAPSATAPARWRSRP